MADTEEYFPRGGKKPVVQHFKQSNNFLGTPEKIEKRKKKPKKKAEADDGYLSEEGAKTDDRSYLNVAVGLNYMTIRTGMTILGRVSKVYETKVVVMLPGRTQGVVMACHVSEPYNKILEAYVNDQIDSIKELPQMFRLGQYVAVKVLEVTIDKGQTHRHQIMLSMMPQHVNAGKTHADLHNGCLLQAVVASEEDHGYVMDIGIPNTKAFLPKKYNNPDLQLDIGAPVWCTIKSLSPSAEHTIVKLTTHTDAIQAGVQKKKSAVILPGTAVDFVVDTPLDVGIEGHIFADMTSCVQKLHADKVKGKKPTLGQKVRARVLYVMPVRNTPFLTLKNVFETPYPDLSVEQKYQDGDIVENAQVINITGRCVTFKLGKSSFGFLNLKRIAVDEDLTDAEVISKSYPVGSTHKVRILCYYLSDYAYSVTDQPSVLNEKYFNISQIKVGDLVDARVTEVGEGHLNVAIGRVNGVVNHMHMRDAGVFVDPKKASKISKKKFKVGQEIKARVLWVEESKQKVGVTVKPSLLAPDLEVLSDYHQAEIGKGYTGVIKIIRHYVLVSFFNNVVAMVPRDYVTKDENVNLTDAFHIGQIVNCTILKVDPEAKKMTGSLVTVPFWPEKKRELKKKRTNQDNQESEQPTNKKKRHNKEAESTEENETEHNKERKKKRDKTTSESDEISESDGKRRKKKKIDELNEDIDKENEEHKKKKSKKSAKTTEDQTEEIETENAKNRKRKRDKKASVSEESDAIETDMPEEEVLSPIEQHLVDLSDCDSAEKVKKRIVSLLKNINARSMRFEKIKKKIENIEEKGLNAYNKKFHTAMHMDKLIVEERIKKLLAALTQAQEKLKQYGDIETKDYKKKKGKKVDNGESDEINDESEVKDERKVKSEDKVQSKVKVVKVKVVDSLEPALEVPSAKDFWSTSADALTKAADDEESSSSDDEQQDIPKKKRKKLSAAEKVAKVRDEEERVRELERRAIDSQSQPRSSDQFERALLANPDCSQLWIAYMAFHLQATEIEKARAVGRKALNTINFREEQERLNVWIALLNCEHRFGTKETQQKTLEEALQMNDRFQVHSKLLDILVDTSKQQELVSLVDLMMRKYKQDPQNYIQCGNACFKLGLVDKARQVMQKAVAVLEKKEHVSVLVQFALMERPSAPERAEALFEQVLAVYPQRVDVCSVYVDMLLKSGDGERIRQVMERMTSQKLPARKMKILYRKWIEVEEKLGDQEQVESIRQKAMEFIDKAKF